MCRVLGPQTGCWDPGLGAVDMSISPKRAAVWLGEPSRSQIMTIFQIITIFFFLSLPAVVAH